MSRSIDLTPPPSPAAATETASATVEISVILPTFRRSATICETIARIRRCVPPPAEIVVHVDAGDVETGTTLAERFPDVRVLNAETRQGPGGGRNRLVAEARHEIIASFDDDSWPIAPEFFQEAWDLLATHTDYALIACRISERGDPEDDTCGETCKEPSAPAVRPAGSFVGCGCVFRRSAFLATSGYIPVPLAYGVEESDLALQMLAAGGVLGRTDSLRVRHDCDREEHHRSSAINGAQIRNTALLAFLRFPIRAWPLATAQVVNRVLYSLRRSRFRGILTGLLSIPGACWRYRALRRPVSPPVFRRWDALRRERAAP